MAEAALDACYAIVFFDAIRVKIRDEGFVRNKSKVYHIALAILPDGVPRRSSDLPDRALTEGLPSSGAEQQSVLMAAPGPRLLVRQRTMVINALRATVREFGLIVLRGRRRWRNWLPLSKIPAMCDCRLGTRGAWLSG